MEFPIFKTERLSLLRIAAGDLEHIYRGLSDPRVIQYYGVSYPTLEATQEQMEWFAGLEESGTGLWWKVCSADGNFFFGCLGFSSLSQEHRKAEIGFWLLPEYWGHGILAEAVPLVVDYAFKGLAVHRIEAFIESENLKSKRAMEKLGFVLEGRMRDCEIKGGRFISLDIYSTISEAL
jgi:ribosomal-protein-alanine N-acetyltransferase